MIWINCGPGDRQQR